MPKECLNTYSRRFMSAEEKLMDKIFMIPESSCWYWTGYHDRDGYAMASAKGIQRAAYRVSYEIFVGPVPKGMMLDHLCRDRGCVNPKHLEPVSSRDNTMRSPIALASINSRRTHCQRGHSLEGDNLVPNLPYRKCMTCSKMVGSAYYFRRKAEGKTRYISKRKRPTIA